MKFWNGLVKTVGTLTVLGFITYIVLGILTDKEQN